VQMVTAIRDSVVVSPGAKMFLNKLIPHTEAYNLNLDISAQEEVVTKNQKKFDNLVDDSVSLVKKIKNLTEDLASNRNKRQEQQKEVEKQKAVLETLKSRRKN
jgi:septal ring factor EnvC (AmiA/AmiB activator)